MVPPCSDRISRVPPYSSPHPSFSHTGLSPAMATLSKVFCYRICRHWPGPRSLATTNGISVDVFSSGYLDVSVPRVRFTKLILFSSVIPFPPHSNHDRSCLERNGEGGFPHSEIVGSKFAHNSPTLIAACHVLHRLYMPRHPPNALTSRLRIHTINDNPA